MDRYRKYQTRFSMAARLLERERERERERGAGGLLFFSTKTFKMGGDRKLPTSFFMAAQLLYPTLILRYQLLFSCGA